jgi:aryl-phospho-beta-D-glucosidase BglC (GH1 family)
MLFSDVFAKLHPGSPIDKAQQPFQPGIVVRTPRNPQTCKPLRINTYETLSKQTTLTSSTINTYKKQRGRGVLSLAKFLVVLGLTLALLTSPSASPAQQPESALARQRAQHLRHGINISEWFAQVYDTKGYTKEHFETWNTAQDIALIKAMDFDHVRLSVNPQPMFRRRQADRIPADYLAYLDAAVKMILDQGLAVVIDVHPDSDFKHNLATDDSFVEDFTDFWRALAKHYSSFDPNLVLFETLNEPEVRDSYRWYGIQARLVAAIRDGAPQHTIIAVGARWDDADDLLFDEPLRDPNIIYNFHFYEPHVFTHQGAIWGDGYWHFVSALPYPADDPEVIAQVAAEVPDPVKRLAIIRYGADHWNATRIDAEFNQVAAWAKHWGVPVVCNEFGVYRKVASPIDRANWLSDVRKSLEKHNIGWTMWDYSGGFGVVTRQNGQPVPDEVTVKALGRAMPPLSH